MADLAKAGAPSPEDGETGVSTDVILSWAAGIFVTGSGHQVYFGTNRDDVNDATTSVDPNNVYQGAQSGTTFDVKNYDPNALVFSTKYYWRVDESNGVTTYKGDVWSFTTDSLLTVDDFDSYASQAELWNVWDDYWGNGTGSEVFIEEGPSPPGIVYTDGNSLKFLYDCGKNYKKVGARIDADIANLEIGPDWTVSGAKALVLQFYGQSGNSATANDRMWVELEDTSSNVGYVLYDQDPNDVKEAEWHEWNIDLALFDACGVSLANVDKVHIGFGGVPIGQSKEGGSGTVYFDDVQVLTQRCVPAKASIADFTDNCIVDGYDLEMMAAEWLAHDGSVLATAPTDVNLVARWEFEGNYNDSNGTNHGVPYGDVTTVSDPCRGNVLSCDGDGDYVEIPGSNTPGGVFDINNHITLSAWVKFSVLANNWPAIIAKGDDTESWRLTRAGKAKDPEAPGIEFCASGVYLVEDGWENPYGNVVGSVPVNDDLWHHAAGVYDGSKICVYIDGIVDTCKDCSGTFTSSAYHVWIGANPVSKEEWTGDLDDVRVYNAALQPGEIAVLAGQEGMLYVPLSVPASQVNLVPKVPPGGPFDPNNLDIVNFLDYGELADDWLKEILWP
jgi:hypothetical protein